MWQSQTVHNAQNNKENQAQRADDKLMTLGMTSAISAALPKPADLVKTKELEESLKPFGVFETEQELNQRMLILGKLYNLVKQWIKEVSLKHNMPESVAENVGGKVYTFGSYRLGPGFFSKKFRIPWTCDDNLLKKLDQKCVRSLNGCRVTDEILRLVPNIENFRLALRAIKLWAKRHGIYSNALGYLGGVSWAMLVAKRASYTQTQRPLPLVHKFFLIFSKWQWPQPVLLKQPSNVNLGFAVWDPRVNIQDRYHLMPIITPAYPQQNSTFNVSQSARHIMMEEFKAGLHTTDDIMLGKCTWNKLFEPPPFFTKYKHFIVLLVTGNSGDHLEWCGLVESKVRLLIGNLERNQFITLAHINPENFSMLESQKEPNSHCSMWFIGLEFAKMENLNVNLTRDIQIFTETVINHAVTIQMFKTGMGLEARHVKRKQLTQYLSLSLIRRERKLSITNRVNGTTENRKRLSAEAAGTDGEAPIKKTRLSEDMTPNFDDSSNASINDSNSNLKRRNLRPTSVQTLFP
ncbi:hypothetical protein NQ318_022081 [Aromia moschata]|uniref:Poly(A) polymerase n=1 Tax=Aromia moschata TaxID=1265417 RepID=A0AAV8Z805_9CUCU|nr:hypothetical protein NQ318_022081 [Aromia moschata]